MQVDGNRIFRVKAVADLLDVHRSTIYRAISSGALDAMKLGPGKGAVRIAGHSVNAYLNSCVEAGYNSYVEGDESPEAADDSTDNQGSNDVAGVA